jgi:ferredoxin-NADP reductase
MPLTYWPEIALLQDHCAEPPNVMMDAIETALGEMNVPMSKYHSERYSFV